MGQYADGCGPGASSRKRRVKVFESWRHRGFAPGLVAVVSLRGREVPGRGVRGARRTSVHRRLVCRANAPRLGTLPSPSGLVGTYFHDGRLTADARGPWRQAEPLDTRSMVFSHNPVLMPLSDAAERNPWTLRGLRLVRTSAVRPFLVGDVNSFQRQLLRLQSGYGMA